MVKNRGHEVVCANEGTNLWLMSLKRLGFFQMSIIEKLNH